MSTLITIGNSQGIRIPKPIIKQAHLEDTELELVIVEEGLLIKPVVKMNRESWVSDIEQVYLNQKNKKDEAFLGDLLNDSDLEEHEW
ncbi:MAG: AbrB/MazE/SpoVT family DNA-binding domain-containing protein [Campylobacterota bacterium]|nr:AbrB/MazE/SpoVT family DNA-binding domain-containing protein [Campylobacterota bacterium]